jgi:hypothetical protein
MSNNLKSILIGTVVGAIIGLLLFVVMLYAQSPNLHHLIACDTCNNISNELADSRSVVAASDERNARYARVIGDENKDLINWFQFRIDERERNLIAAQVELLECRRENVVLNKYIEKTVK